MEKALTNGVINVHVDPKDKEEVTNILKDLGLNMTSLINMTLKQVIKRNGIPFDVVNNPAPSKDMIEALGEINEMLNNPEKYPRYDNWDDLKKALLSDD